MPAHSMETTLSHQSVSQRRVRSTGAVHVAVRNWMLLIVLGVMVGYWVTGDGGGSIRQRSVEPLVEGFSASKVRSVLLERPDAAAVATAGIARTTLTLRLATEAVGTAAETDAWTIGELFGAAAFTDRVDRLLSRIGSMTTLDLVTADSSTHAEYGLTNERALRVRISSEDTVGETPMVDLLLAPAPDRGTYVRLHGDSNVWRVAQMTPPSPSPRAWFDDSSLMPWADLAISGVRASGSALESEALIRSIAGGQERFTNASSEALSSQLVLDFFKRMRTLFPVDVIEGKAEGAILDPSPWLRLEIMNVVGGKKFRIEFREPGTDVASDAGPTKGTVRAAVVEGTAIVSVSGSTVEKLVQSLRSLMESPQNR
ncbi:MAG: hypothetical protein ACI80K_000457 [Paracoccaceae bacterium]|jgi:hypothetical protein